ncbi:hypothetical protein LMH66_14515 [Shewanella sp. 10N.7]|uniref:hypothetical protein n=1 Tax=Shewanella sp. 10N.7 TaxID=2885093 RepID=UPI001E5F263A|nr:hypothetical protein [Shewanella sp. 10N.7]MCC4833854.1 hypothetical protein [Shewanella sp. 10N.7]
MSVKLSHHIIIFFALFALLGQGLVTNGYAMVAMPMTHIVDKEPTSDAATEDVESATMDCHQQVSTNIPSIIDSNKQSKHCCDSITDIAQTEPSSCCDSVAGCSLDCSHCMKISMTGHMQNVDIIIAKSLNIKAEATKLPHFFYHQTLPAFKPPIA